uniref:Uncharacterized protein n=1 Tax=Arundo donax TaxID=35708 RepID=A0A0A9HI63_ARUDO
MKELRFMTECRHLICLHGSITYKMMKDS